MLVDHDPLAFESASGEEIEVALEIGLPPGIVDGWESALFRRLDHTAVVENGLRGRAAVLLVARAGHGLQDAGLVRLQDLARALVELDAVAVERDVTAGDHDAGRAFLHGVKGEGGRRDAPEVDELQARILDRAR